MAQILFFEGFDQYPASAVGAATSGELAASYYTLTNALSAMGNGFYARIEAADAWPDAAVCQELSLVGLGTSSTSRLGIARPLPTLTASRVIVGFRFRLRRDEALPTTVTNVLGVGHAGANLFFVQTDGSIALAVDGTSEQKRIPMDGTYSYLEFEFDAASGTLRAWVDDNVVHESSATVAAATSLYLSALRFDAASQHTIGIRDLYVAYGADAQRIGRTARVHWRPAAADVQAEWTRAAGSSNASQVGHHSAASDATALQSATPGALDLYTATAALPEDAGLIYALGVTLAGRRTDAQARRLIQAVRSGAATDYAAVGLPAASTYINDLAVFDADPATGEGWTRDAALAASFGVLLDAQAHTAPVIGARVWTKPESGELGVERINARSQPVFVADDYYASHPLYSAITAETVDGQAMVRIPAFYYRRSAHQWWISPEPLAGFALHPAFYKAGAAVDHFLIGAYEASADADDSTKIASVAGAAPLVSTSRANFLAMATARNVGDVSGFRMWDIYQLGAIQMLALIELASFDVQSAIAAGADADAPVTTGSTACVWRGIHELWGNSFQYIDGLLGTHAAPTVWLPDGSQTYATLTGVVTTSGYPTTIASGSAALDALFLPGARAAAATFLPDYYTYTNSTNANTMYPMVGGGYNSAATAGLWTLQRIYNVSGGGVNISSRIAKV
ncbi:MAG: hypothetical protein QM617_09225 [Comamonas sp.]